MRRPVRKVRSSHKLPNDQKACKNSSTHHRASQIYPYFRQSNIAFAFLSVPFSLCMKCEECKMCKTLFRVMALAVKDVKNYSALFQQSPILSPVSLRICAMIARNRKICFFFLSWTSRCATYKIK